jgi:hypothetical protein
MTEPKHGPRFEALRALEDTFLQHCSSRTQDAASPEEVRQRRASWWRIRGGLHRPLVRRLLLIGGATVAIAGLATGGLWLRLMSGPIEINLASPFVAAAIEENIGRRHHVEIGGTQIERDQTGRASLRIRDILIRDADQNVVASAPKAEVSISGSGLLTGQVRARRVSLVGAELAVRIEQDGQVTISTGAERRPLAVTPAIVKPGAAIAPAASDQPAAADSAILPTGAERFVAFVGWLDRLSTLGLDGEGLGEIGLKDGTLKVDDLRTDKHWTFDKINFSVNRAGGGTISVALGSDNEERPWLLTAGVRPSGFQRRSIQIEARKVSTKDLFLATRLDEGQFQSDIPLSGVIRAEIGPDSLPATIEGRIVADGGLIGDPADIDGSFQIDKAEISIDWDANRKSLIAPLQIHSGANRITLLSQFDAPSRADAPWRLTVTGGSVVLAAGRNDPQPLVLNRILIRAICDPVRRRIEVVQGDIGGSGVQGALNGSVDFSGAEPRLAAGLAITPMSSNAAKKVWPVFVASKVRTWVLENLQGGEIERVDIATNAPIDTLKEGGPPLPADGLSVEVTVRNATIAPVDGLPAISEADLKTQIKGRNVTVTVNRGVVEMSGGRKLVLSNGVFEIPDTHPKSPPARVRFRVDGPVQAAAEFLSLERMRDHAGLPLDPATSKGNFSGQVTLGMPIMKDPPKGSTSYAMAFDIAGFGADKMMMGQKIEAQALKVAATNQGYQIRGDVRINGTPATLDFRKNADSPDADVRIQATLDEAARARFGFDTGPALSGPVPVKISGKYASDKDTRLSVEADLTQAKIENLMPGWVKPVGKQNRATFTLVTREKTTRFEDLVIDGSGANVRGTVELDSSGDLASANFPTFALSDGDKASLRVDKASDGTVRIAMRGEVYDGRGFVKAALGSDSDQKPKRTNDFDLDLRLGAVVGFNGEALRGVDLKLTRRAGHIRSFALNSKIGRDTPLTGDLRGAAARGRNVLYFETLDAGALFRFTDTYPRMHGGQMWIAMDPPTPDHAPTEGILNIRDFKIRGEAALNRVVGQAQNGTAGVDFTRMRVDFTRAAGKLTIKEGVVRGPTVGATVDGQIDYASNEVRMRGTFVPLYGLNNAFGQLPIVGLFLGGSNEGLVGITYEVVGPPGSPTLRVNPISAVAPGLLRKFFEFPGANTQGTTSTTGFRDDAPPATSSTR